MFKLALGAAGLGLFFWWGITRPKELLTDDGLARPVLTRHEWRVYLQRLPQAKYENMRGIALKYGARWAYLRGARFAAGFDDLSSAQRFAYPRKQYVPRIEEWTTGEPPRKVRDHG